MKREMKRKNGRVRRIRKSKNNKIWKKDNKKERKKERKKDNKKEMKENKK